MVESGWRVASHSKYANWYFIAHFWINSQRINWKTHFLSPLIFSLLYFYPCGSYAHSTSHIHLPSSLSTSIVEMLKWNLIWLCKIQLELMIFLNRREEEKFKRRWVKCENLKQMQATGESGKRLHSNNWNPIKIYSSKNREIFVFKSFKSLLIFSVYSNTCKIFFVQTPFFAIIIFIHKIFFLPTSSAEVHVYKLKKNEKGIYL